MLPGTLDRAYKGTRILSDRGIRQALEMGLITICPQIDEAERIQPATLDVKISRIEFLDTFGEEDGRKPQQRIIPAKSKVMVKLTESIETFRPFISIRAEARSSVRRLGLFSANPSLFYTNNESSHIEIGNFSQNDVAFEYGNRIAQLFFIVDPFRDLPIYEGDNPIYSLLPHEEYADVGEKVRSLDMGVEISEDGGINDLAKLMNVSPLQCYKGMVLVHAGNTAYRMKSLGKPIDFSNRSAYSNEELLEPIDIRKGYEIRPFEHIIIETAEKFELSDKVGIWFWDNLRFAEELKSYSHMRLPRILENLQMAMANTMLTTLPEGWIDPGYEGGFSRQPKWASSARTVKPGDIVGFGQAFYFPNGVENPYGAIKGSQWQGNLRTKVV